MLIHVEIKTENERGLAFSGFFQAFHQPARENTRPGGFVEIFRYFQQLLLKNSYIVFCSLFLWDILASRQMCLWKFHVLNKSSSQN